MGDPRRTETTANRTGQDSSASRLGVPANHPSRSRFRVVAVVTALVAVVWSIATVGFTDPITAVAAVIAALVIAAAVPGGNLSALGHTALGTLLLLLGLAQLALLNTSLNPLHASVLNVCGLLLLGLVVGACGLYEWETDEHGRIDRRLRGA
jgi:peptidoglycan/LPS O-acetylase OafA/YrhL